MGVDIRRQWWVLCVFHAMLGTFPMLGADPGQGLWWGEGAWGVLGGESPPLEAKKCSFLFSKMVRFDSSFRGFGRPLKRTTFGNFFLTFRGGGFATKFD